MSCWERDGGVAIVLAQDVWDAEYESGVSIYMAVFSIMFVEA